VNPNITFEVLIHKVDGLSDDYKIDTQRDIQQRTADALADAQMEHIHLSYYLTSIYDHSIYEAFSKIIQKLIRELPTLENLLNVLCSVSRHRCPWIIKKTLLTNASLCYFRILALTKHICLILSQKYT
jgi:hypothetical protein